MCVMCCMKHDLCACVGHLDHLQVPFNCGNNISMSADDNYTPININGS